MATNHNNNKNNDYNNNIYVMKRTQECFHKVNGHFIFPQPNTNIKNCTGHFQTE